jgi:hypothetical protein
MVDLDGGHMTLISGNWSVLATASLGLKLIHQ